LSDRIHVDGNVGDFDDDEWLLDDATSPAETAHDSRWGTDNDIARLGVTWDHARLYLSVALTLRNPQAVMVLIGNGPGGLSSLDAAGEFRRVIDLPFSPNIVALAVPGAAARVARADETHAFALVDAAAIPAVLSPSPALEQGFQMAVPWSVLDPTRPLRIVVAVTGGTGDDGAGDAAPDPRATLYSDHRARATLDRWIELTADADGDGIPDDGVSPRAIAVVRPDTAASRPAANDELSVHVLHRAFAPDNGESTTLALRPAAGGIDAVDGTCVIHNLEGRRVRTLPVGSLPGSGEPGVSWDGRDDSGRVCEGGAYVAAFDVRYTLGGAPGHATPRTGVAVIR
jgi:hypothetical protein